MRKHFHFSVLVCLLSICFTNAFAQSGKSLVLNGTDQYMRIAHHADFNIASEESFTVTAWVKAARFVETGGKEQRFIAKRSLEKVVGDNNTGYELWGAVSTSKFYANNAPNQESSHTNSMSVWSTTSGRLNEWTHIGLVVDRVANKMYLYHNGVQVGTSGTKDVSKWYVNNIHDVLLGAGLSNPTTPDFFFQGELDNVRFYKKALNTTALVADKGNNSIDPTTEGLVAAYDFENVEGLKVADLTGKHDGLLVNYPVEGAITIASVKLTQDPNFTGRGNKNEVILKAQVTAAGKQSVDLSSLKLNMNGTTTLTDVQSIRVYSTGNSAKFDPRKAETYTKLGECAPAAGDLTCNLTGTLSAGDNYLWITYDLADKAKEGNRVDASLLAITTASETYTLTTSTVAGAREILLARKLLFAPGDLGSTHYRIPAIVTAHDGSLVIATDKRKFNQGDLPGDIDVLINRSTDGGKTWSAALTIAQGAGEGKGFGDAAIARTNEPNGLICIFVGGQGFFSSTPSNPIRTYICKSSDNGVTWTKPTDITNQLFGADCTDPIRKKWYGSFCASGAGLLTRDGRICFVGSVRETSSQNVSTMSNYVYYSDDNGTTWKVSGCVMPNNSNEAKIVELNDGTLLVSVRNQAKGARYYSKSTDGGATWSTVSQWKEMVEPGCDGDILYYTSTKDGYEKNRILHSVPDHASDRVNVSVFVSYDEAKTWPVKKSICPTGSAYSSLCILEDGTIGAYVEENYNTGDYSMYFTNFSLEWLTDGSDAYHAPGTVEAVAAPTFSVAGGSYEEEQSVALATTTPDAKIYYTLDGSSPSAASILYEEPIAISATTTVKAIAVKAGMVDSSIASATYTFSPSGKYCYPAEGASATNLKDTYLKSITTTGATNNLAYTATSRTFYIKPGTVQAGIGKTISLHLVAYSLGEYSTSTVKQDLRYAAAGLFIDWDQDGEFSVAEGVKLKGTTPPPHNVGGNFDVLDITHEITVPTTAKEGKARVRVVYNNAWGGDVLAKACGPVTDGVVVDFDINVVEESYTLTIAQPAMGGSIIVKDGDSPLANEAVVKSGTELTVEATPASADYMLKSILVNGEAITGNAFTVTSDVEVSAQFVECVTFSYAFDKTKGSIGVTANAAPVASGSKVELGTQLSVAIVPEPGCSVEKLMVNGVDRKEELLANGNTFTYTINEATEMEAVFDIRKFDLTCNTPLYGTVELTDEEGNPMASGDKLAYGMLLNLKLIPATGGDLLELLIDEGDGEVDYVQAEGYLEKDADGNYLTYLQAFDNITIRAVFKEVENSIGEQTVNGKVYLDEKGNLMIEGAAIGSVISVYNVTGQMLATIQTEQEIERVPVSGQPIYLVKINNASGSVVKKITK